MSDMLKCIRAFRRELTTHVPNGHRPVSKIILSEPAYMALCHEISSLAFVERSAEDFYTDPWIQYDGIRIEKEVTD